MKIFELQAPVSSAIKSKMVSLVDESSPGSSDKINFISHEPTQSEIVSYPEYKTEEGFAYDGAVSVFAKDIGGESSSSQTGEQDTTSTLVIDCYGFGSVFTDNGIETKSIVSAEKRAQLLTTLAYKAIMDQTELGESFGTNITIGEKKFLSVEKVGALGTEVTNRAICFYRALFNFKIEEDVPTEPLGPEYDSGTANQETLNEKPE